MKGAGFLRLALAFVFIFGGPAVLGITREAKPPATGTANVGSVAAENERHPLFMPASYIYIMPKAATRHRLLHARAVQEQRLNSLRHQTNQTAIAQSATNSPSHVVPPTVGSTQRNQNENAAGAVSTLPQFQQVRPMISTNAPGPKPSSKPKAEAARSQPVHEVSGPAYNDNDTLLEFQREQAQKGSPESQYAIGLRYLNGTGVPQDEQQAREWFEKASAQGNLKAREKLHELNARKGSVI